MCPSKEMLSAYYDNEVDPKTSERLAEHISQCHQCREYLHKQQQLTSWFEQSEQELPSLDVDASYTNLMRDLRRVERFRQPGVSPHALWRFAASIVIILAVIGFLAFRLNNGRTLNDTLVENTPSPGDKIDTIIIPDENYTIYGEPQFVHNVNY